MKVFNTISVFLKMIIMVVGAALLGMLLMWAVYLLPTAPMAENVVASEETLRKFDDSQFYIDEEYWKINDTTTNSIVLHEVIYPNTDDAFKDSLLSPTANFYIRWFDNWTDVILEYASERDYQEDEYVTYARYWHGYLVILKPLFMFLDLHKIHLLNGMVLLFLTIYIIYLFKNKFAGKYYWIIYLLTVLLMNPINLIQSFQMSAIFWVMQIILVLILSRDNWKNEQILYIFVFDGILVAFLDFLTYPLVAFAIPFLTVFVLKQEESFINNIKNVVNLGVAFVVGYAGMWGMKWVLASIFTSENVIVDAIESILHRTGIEENVNDWSYNDITVEGALRKNFFAFFNEQNLFILLIIVAICGVLFFVNRKKIIININYQLFIICLFSAVLPFIWMVVLYNHCALHPHLEWRTFSVLVYTVGILIMSLFSTKERGDFCDKN